MVLTGASRLAAAGIAVPLVGLAPGSPQLELYGNVASAHRRAREAHPRYIRFLQRLVSFGCVLERAAGNRPAGAGQEASRRTRPRLRPSGNGRMW